MHARRNDVVARFETGYDGGCSAIPAGNTHFAQCDGFVYRIDDPDFLLAALF
jgi:hypothetical protein